jgi:uncharacterized protein with HEPN domain
MRAEREFLNDMLGNPRTVQRKISGKRFEDFVSDENLQDAVLRRIGIIGEAASKISAETRAAINVPWGQIIRMRNVLVHVYFGVDLNVAWITANDHMEPLIAAIEAHLKARELGAGNP